MHTVLVGPDLEENLSLSYLRSAIEHAGHQCTLLTFNDGRHTSRLAKKIASQRPDVVGLSLVAQWRYGDFQKLLVRLRQDGYRGHITAGGHFASLRAKEVLSDTPEIDSIIHHDGETRIVQLLGLLANDTQFPGSMDGISWRGSDGGIHHVPPSSAADLDTLRFPQRRRPDKTLGHARAPIVSSRGCSGSCAFCSIHAWHKQVPSGRLRYRSPRNVSEEMVSLHRTYGVRIFVFHDDDFIHPDPRIALSRCRDILDEAKRGIGKPIAFVIKCRPDDVEEQLFGYLHSKGLARAYVGIETHAVSGLKVLNRRVSPSTNVEALRILRRVGVYGCFNLLIFHPDTTIAELRENLAFLREHASHPFDVARTELYARSLLEDRMLLEGRAIGSYRGYDYRIRDPRAETAFQLFSRVLWDRHFGGNSILHRTQDLGFRRALLSRLHPETATTDLQSRVESLIRSVNSATIDHLESIVALATEGNHISEAAIVDLQRAVDARTKLDTIRWASLVLEVESRAFAARSILSRTSPAKHVPRLVGKIAAAIPCLGLFLGPVACNEGTGTVCDPPPPPALSFADDVAPLLDRGCATSGCHSAESASANLVLSSETSYENTVEVPSTQAPERLRIAPGHPASSYIVDKLLDGQEEVGGSGVRMPKDGVAEPPLISNLKKWISSGAEDN